MRIGVTASRNWYLYSVMLEAMSEHHTDGNVLVVGRGGNGDHMAERIAESLGWDVDPHPARWDQHGIAAGPIRNKQMVDSGMDVLLAFIRPCTKSQCPHGKKPHDSHGAANTVHLAQAAGVPVVIYRR